MAIIFIHNLPGVRPHNHYRCNGSSSDTTAKIQLKYELFTGNFIQCEIVEWGSNDADYLPTLEKGIDPNDLHLKDLGYFKAEHFKYIEKCGAYYLSKIKSTTAMKRILRYGRNRIIN